MKKNILLVLFTLFGIALQAQIFQDNFESYTTNKALERFWYAGNSLQLDTLHRRSGSRSIKIEKQSYLIYKMPNKRMGKIDFALMSAGPGIWNVRVSIGTGLDFANDKQWKTIDEFATEPALSDFYTKTANINQLDQYFVKLSFDPIGTTTPLYLDDITVNEISSEAERIILQQQQQEQMRAEREKHFRQLMENAGYEDAKKLVNSFKLLYKKRIKTMGMLYDKTNMIKIVSGTASTLGDFNQLGNPLRYEKFTQMRNILFPRLETIDTLFYADQVQGRLQSFYKKIENPLNIAIGVGDIFTGGAISKVVDSFKSLVTKGFSSERLLTFVRERDVKNEQTKGIALYLEAKSFFEDVEEQNTRTLMLNKKISDVYLTSKGLNDEVLTLFVDFLSFSKVVVERQTIIDLSKNQNYSQFDADIEKYFDYILGDEKTFNKEQVTDRLKEIDLLAQKINVQIRSYNRLSNQLSSFYSDFRKETERPCPFRNVTPADRQRWDSQVYRVRSTLSEVERAFNESYTEVNFLQ